MCGRVGSRRRLRAPPRHLSRMRQEGHIRIRRRISDCRDRRGFLRPIQTFNRRTGAFSWRGLAGDGQPLGGLSRDVRPIPAASIPSIYIDLTKPYVGRDPIARADRFLSDPARLRLFPRLCTALAERSGLPVMSSQAGVNHRSFGTSFRNSWNAFTRTAPGDAFAALLTIAVMFAAIFSCAIGVSLAMDVMRLVFRSH